MSTARFTEEFKLEAVKQITQHQRPVAEVAKRLGVSTHSLYVWVITYIRTHEGWLYLAVVLDLFSRQVVGWSMDSRMSKDLVLQASRVRQLKF